MDIAYKFLPGNSAAVTLSAVTTGTGTAIAFNDCGRLLYVVEGTGTISGGTILIESADTANYAGTWIQLASISASSLTGGAAAGDNLNAPPGTFVRGRISSNITGGGTVTVRLNGIRG